MTQSRKNNFFKEKTRTDSGELLEESDLVFPGSGLYVGPYSKSVKRDAVIMEISSNPDDDSELTYIKEEDAKYFAACRRDLPRFFIDSRVQVRMTPNMGKGCFALKDIEKNTVVESAPVILMHQDTFTNLNDYCGGTHKLSEYPFGWGRDGVVAISLGYGGIYNHNVIPNLTWRPDYEAESLTYTTCRDIVAGEELFIRYVPLSKLDTLWFFDEESDKYANQYRAEFKEDLGTLKSWSIFHKS